MTQNKLQDILNKNKKLSYNWDLFYSFQNKVWVCQTISDLLSFISVINWSNSIKVSWQVIEDWFLHQISKINNYYYDPTFDIWYKNTWYKNFKYFWMTLNQVEKYLKIIKQ